MKGSVMSENRNLHKILTRLLITLALSSFQLKVTETRNSRNIKSTHPSLVIASTLLDDGVTTEAGVLQNMWNKISNVFSRDVNENADLVTNGKRRSSSRENNIEQLNAQNKLHGVKRMVAREKVKGKRERSRTVFQEEPKFLSKKEIKNAGSILAEERAVDSLSNTLVNTMGKVANVFLPETTTVWLDRRIPQNQDNSQVNEKSNQRYNPENPKQHIQNTRLDKQNNWHILPVTSEQIAKKEKANTVLQQAQGSAIQDSVQKISESDKNIPPYHLPRRNEVPLPPIIKDHYGPWITPQVYTEKSPGSSDLQQKRNGVMEGEDEVMENRSEKEQKPPSLADRLQMKRTDIISNSDAESRLQSKAAEISDKNEKSFDDEDAVVDEGQEVDQELTKVIKISPNGIAVHKEKIRKVMKETSLSEVENENLPPGANIEGNNLEPVVPPGGGKIVEPELGTTVHHIEEITSLEPIVEGKTVASGTMVNMEEITSLEPVVERKTTEANHIELEVNTLPPEELNVGSLKSTTSVGEFHEETSYFATENIPTVNEVNVPPNPSLEQAQHAGNATSAIQAVKDLLSRLGTKSKLDLMMPFQKNFNAASVEMKIIDSALHINFILPLSSQEQRSNSGDIDAIEQNGSEQF